MERKDILTILQNIKNNPGCSVNTASQNALYGFMAVKRANEARYIEIRWGKTNSHCTLTDVGKSMLEGSI